MPPRRHRLPVPSPLIISKKTILDELASIDSNMAARDRVLKLENGFRERISSSNRALPGAAAEFGAFNTNPFVLMAYCKNRGYSKVSQIEKDIVPAKLFSSMETSAGRMVEDVALPIYGWEGVPSGMHTSNSALDGRRVDEGILRLVTLKSGPRCLNDEMSENFADQIVNHYKIWADDSKCKDIDFTYGVLYGTKKYQIKRIGIF